MKIALQSVPNIDFQNDDRLVRLHSVEIKSIDEAKDILRGFIADNDLGGGNFTEQTGRVYGNDGTHLMTISYNLRAWGLDGKEQK